MNDKTPIERAIEIAGLRPLTRKLGLASDNAVRAWKKAGRVPLDNPADYAGIIEAATSGEVTRAAIWQHQLDDLRPGVLYALPIASVAPDPNQPRQVFEQAALDELAADIRVAGIQTPVSFRRAADKKEVEKVAAPLVLINGERRFKAAQLAGLQAIPAYYDTNAENLDAGERLIRQASDNANREDLTPWDWACMFQQLNKRHGRTHDEIARDMSKRGIKGFSRPVVSNFIRLLTLPQWAQDMIKAGWLNPSHGKALLSIKSLDVLAAMGSKLKKAKREFKDAPPASFMDVEIRDTYAEIFPHVDGQLNGSNPFPVTPAFDIAEQCPTCPTSTEVKLSSGHKSRFCCNTDCFTKRHESAIAEATRKRALQRAQAEADEKTASEALESLGRPDETPANTRSINRPETPPQARQASAPGKVEYIDQEKAIQEHQAREGDFMRSMARREALGNALDDAILATDEARMLALMCWISDDGLDDDGREITGNTLEDYHAAIKHDQTKTVQTVLRHLVNVLGDQTAATAARFLGVDASAIVSQETTQQQLPV